MIHEELSISIRQPVETVFAFLTDLMNAPRWYQNCLAIKDASPGPVGVGTTFLMVTKALGRRFETRYECSQYEPNRCYTVRAIAGPVAGQSTTTLETTDGEPASRSLPKWRGAPFSNWLSRLWPASSGAIKQPISAP